ncbi:hypothetical protein [uncultured Catenibacterium sp.]|uniref:hypothetical protein n=1 Tax=uncultured Catenibacterium sp. TaxID=286142 RepID=UPI0025F19F45|nr:hypothetical protein [uncultured Catenibacterium sp.]
MNNEELTKVIDNMQRINCELLKQNDKLNEELRRSNRDFFWLAGMMTVVLLLILYALWGI